MLDYRTVAYIDDNPIQDQNEFSERYNKDLKIEVETCVWSCRSAYDSDLGNGREVTINEHTYQYKNEMVSDSAKEVLTEFINTGIMFDEMFSAIQKLNETDSAKFLDSMGIKKSNNGYVFECE